MLISIITATHKPIYINELYQSIISQTYSNWEWVLLLNNGIYESDISYDIRNDNRVKIHELYGENSNVGFLKNIAFNYGIGEILVEVDHDDIILPNCLDELYNAFHDNEIGFVYSDNIVHNEKSQFIPYSSKNGWTYRDFIWNDIKYIAMNSFEPSSASLAFIWYAPDHVRAWRKSVYDLVGGHDVNLSVLDDHDLLIRTYLVTKFYHIPKVLYVYRVTGNNTWLERNQQIQIGTVQLYNKYAYKLAERDADLKGLIKVDIGGGLNPRIGYKTIDMEDADIICDLNNGIPLEDNSVGIINASHVLEHLNDPIKSMKEIYRVLCDGGWAMIDVPSTDGRGAFMDPTHISYWNQNSFMYYTQAEQASYIRNKTIKFQAFRCETHFPNNWYKNNDIPVVTAYLRAIKSNSRRPHLINI